MALSGTRSSRPSRDTARRSCRIRTSCSGPFDTVRRPGRVTSASMPSVAQKRSMSASVCTIAPCIAFADSSPTLRTRSWRLRPTIVIANPPLRPDAPKPTVSLSRTTMRRPGSSSASRIADQSPVKPAPMMTMSARWLPSRRPRFGGDMRAVARSCHQLGADGALISTVFAEHGRRPSTGAIVIGWCLFVLSRRPGPDRQRSA